MQAKLSVKCGQCERHLGVVSVDTADMPDELQAKVNKVILAHRKDCRYYAEITLKDVADSLV